MTLEKFLQQFVLRLKSEAALLLVYFFLLLFTETQLPYYHIDMVGIVLD